MQLIIHAFETPRLNAMSVGGVSATVRSIILEVKVLHYFKEIPCRALRCLKMYLSNLFFFGFFFPPQSLKNWWELLQDDQVTKSQKGCSITGNRTKEKRKDLQYFQSQGELGSPLVFWNHRLNIDDMIWYSGSYRTPSEQHNTIWLGLYNLWRGLQYPHNIRVLYGIVKSPMK